LATAADAVPGAPYETGGIPALRDSVMLAPNAEKQEFRS